jgi:predicted dehydrogenase
MLPHHLHEEAAVRAFAAGKHVVLEKPMAPTVESCDRILAAARAAGTVFMVAEQAQYWPDAVQVQRLIRDGALGQLLSARAYFGSPAHPVTGPKPWRYRSALAGGGICIDGGAHWLRPLRMWLGEIDEVVATVGRPLAEMEGESLAHALLRFDSGTVAAFEALHGGASMEAGDEFRVTGTHGEILIEKGSGGRVLLFDQDHPHGEVILSKGEGRRAAFGYELHDFACAVLDGTPLAAGPEYSLGELRTALAIYRSAATRQWEKVWDRL